MKTLAVVVTAYNAQKYILETLHSLKDQTLPIGWRTKFYIGIDACEKTAEVLKENKISYYYAEENVGTYVLTNSLLEEAKKDNCDMFLRFDSDDIARENFLLYGIQHAENIGFVRPYFNYCTETGKPKGSSNPVEAHGQAFMTIEALENLGGYHHYRVACDTDLILRARKLGYQSKITNNFPLFYYRRVIDSLSKSAKTGKKSTYRKQIIDELNRSLYKGIIKIQNPKITSLVFHK